MRAGEGFLATPEISPGPWIRASSPGLEKHIFDFRNGRDITDTPRGIKVIDAFGLTSEQLRNQFPTLTNGLGKGQAGNVTTTIVRGCGNSGGFLLIDGKHSAQHSTVCRVISPRLRQPSTGYSSPFPDTALPEHNSSLSPSTTLSLWAFFPANCTQNGRWPQVALGRPPALKLRCFETFPFPDDDTGLTPNCASASSCWPSRSTRTASACWPQGTRAYAAPASTQTRRPRCARPCPRRPKKKPSTPRAWWARLRQLHHQRAGRGRAHRLRSSADADTDAGAAPAGGAERRTRPRRSRRPHPLAAPQLPKCRKIARKTRARTAQYTYPEADSVAAKTAIKRESKTQPWPAHLA